MKVQTDIVLTNVVVRDKKTGEVVKGLKQSDFTILENGKPQAIASFDYQNVDEAAVLRENSTVTGKATIADLLNRDFAANPAALRDHRLIVMFFDLSSMQPEDIDRAVQSAQDYVSKKMQPADLVALVSMATGLSMDQDFTSDLSKMREALEKVDTRGGTALYDAVVASADHLRKNGKLEKKVLLVVTDGEDNESQESLEQAIRRLQEENGPTVYALGLLGEEKQRRARKALQFMAEKTGGIAFFPKTLDQVDEISRQVAHDIRNQYTIGYKPTNPKSSGGYRAIKVDAKAKGYGKLTVRTKSGYYAGQERASASAK